MPNKINMYRASSKATNRTSDGTETRPLKLDRLDVLRMADAVNTALANNLPGAKTAAANLLTHMLAEGRADAGTNGIDYNSNKSIQLVEDLDRAGVNYTLPVSNYTGATDPRNYVVVSAEKEASAKRLGKPLAEVWNGTGRSATTGRTGAQHVNRFDQAAAVVNSPKNAEIKSLVDRVINSGLTQAETFDVRRPEIWNAVGANMSDSAGYSVQWNSGAKSIPKTAKDIVGQLPSYKLQNYMPQLVTNLLAASAGAQAKPIQGMTSNQQSEYEILFSSPSGRKLLEESNVLPK